jgi:hypothetical protein
VTGQPTLRRLAAMSAVLEFGHLLNQPCSKQKIAGMGVPPCAPTRDRLVQSHGLGRDGEGLTVSAA